MLIANTGYQLGDIQVLQVILLNDRTVIGGLQLIKIMIHGLQETAQLIMGLVGMIDAVLHVLLTKLIEQFGFPIKELVVV